MLATKNAQYAEERAEVEVLKAKAQKHTELARQIRASLGRLNDRGPFWREAEGSFYNDTRNSRVVNRNVENILNKIQNLQVPLDGKIEEEATIRAGPSGAGIQVYVAALKSIQKQHARLANTNIRVNQEAAQKLVKMINEGESRILDVFQATIKEISQPVEPMNYLTKEIPFPSIGEDKISGLLEIDSFIADIQARKPSGTTSCYSDNRGAYLRLSLQSLSAATINTSKLSPDRKDYKPGSSRIVTYTNAIEGMFVAEWNAVATIFSANDRSLVYELTTKPALEGLKNTLKGLNDIIKANPIQQYFLGFEVIDAVQRLGRHLDKSTRQLKLQITEALRPIVDSTRNCLSELIEDIRRKSATWVDLPPRSGAIDYTSVVMNRLALITQYLEILRPLLAAIGDGMWQNTANNVLSSAHSTKSADTDSDRKNALVANYIVDTLETLYQALDATSRKLIRDKGPAGLFVANNIAVMMRDIRRSDIDTIIGQATRSNRMEENRKRAIGAYLAAWQDLSRTLIDVQYTSKIAANRPISGTANDSAAIVKALGSKEKEAIKKKFDTFNTSFGELVAKHKEYSPTMQDEVRTQIARDIQGFVEQLYWRFWDKYHEIDKGKGKHVKYDKSSFSAQITALGDR